MKTLDEASLAPLLAAATAASRQAYAPYSHFSVGAAVQAGSGRIYPGVNVENACSGLGICAERAAFFAAVAAGERTFRCVVVATRTPAPTPPCGACRQVMHEFAPDLRIICICDTDKLIDTTLDALLPGAFGSTSLDTGAS